MRVAVTLYKASTGAELKREVIGNRQADRDRLSRTIAWAVHNGYGVQIVNTEDEDKLNGKAAQQAPRQGVAS